MEGKEGLKVLTDPVDISVINQQINRKLDYIRQNCMPKLWDFASGWGNAGDEAVAKAFVLLHLERDIIRERALLTAGEEILGTATSQMENKNE